MTDELAFLTIAEAAKRIEHKQVSPVELVAALIRRTEATQRISSADRGPGSRSGAAGRAGDHDGTLPRPDHGIPFALKDICATAGIRTTGHSRICLDSVPS